MHTIAAKAVAFHEALSEDFVEYQKLVLKNAKSLSNKLAAAGLRIVTGDTDTHMLLVDVSNFNLTGKLAEEKLGDSGIIVNRNTIPYDPNPPRICSGIRIGTAAISSRGMNEDAISIISECIIEILKNNSENNSIKEKILFLANEYPINID